MSQRDYIPKPGVAPTEEVLPRESNPRAATAKRLGPGEAAEDPRGSIRRNAVGVGKSCGMNPG